MSDADALRAAGKCAGDYVAQNSGATETIFSAVFGQ